MNYHKRFVVEPGAKVRLDKIDPGFKNKHEESRHSSKSELQKQVERLAKASVSAIRRREPVIAGRSAGARRRW